MILSSDSIKLIKGFYNNAYKTYSFVQLIRMTRLHINNSNKTFYVSLKEDYDHH